MNEHESNVNEDGSEKKVEGTEEQFSESTDTSSDTASDTASNEGGEGASTDGVDTSADQKSE